MLQFIYARAGMLTSSYVSNEINRIELSVHFSTPKSLFIPEGYKYTYREIKSYPKANRNANSTARIRVAEFVFEY